MLSGFSFRADLINVKWQNGLLKSVALFQAEEYLKQAESISEGLSATKSPKTIRGRVSLVNQMKRFELFRAENSFPPILDSVDGTGFLDLRPRVRTD